jgi:S-adenosylmethionine decarboxylase
MLADLYGISAPLLRDAHALESVLKEAARVAGAQVLHGHFHCFGEQQGVTGVVLLAESHVSIHTWPESGFAALDIFMCGSADAELALTHIAQALRPTLQQVERVARGAAQARRRTGSRG